MGPQSGRTTPLPGDVTDGSPSLHRVFSIGEDRAGNIWFGTVENGAWRYDGKSLRNYTAQDGLTSKDIMCVYTDRHGDLWLAGNGVFKFNGASFDRIR
jgi:ligand-binding sensor domain-containing protein